MDTSIQELWVKQTEAYQTSGQTMKACSFKAIAYENEKEKGETTRLCRDVPDSRRGNGIRHKFEKILIIAILAMIKIAALFELSGGIPSHDTFGDVLAMLDPKALHEAFRQWVETIRKHISKEVIVVDGKKVRRSKDLANGKRPLYLVIAWANENQRVLGQMAIDEKSNEITAIPELLKLLHCHDQRDGNTKRNCPQSSSSVPIMCCKSKTINRHFEKIFPII